MAEGSGTYITWNIVNWITVVLMVGVGMVLVAGVVSVVRQGLPGGTGS